MFSFIVQRFIHGGQGEQVMSATKKSIARLDRGLAKATIKKEKDIL